MQHVQSYASNPANTGSLAMPQNPPPFKRFARERFDGASLYGQRPTVPTAKDSESPSRISLSDSQHTQRHIQPHSSPTSEQISMDYTPSHESTVPQSTSHRSRPREQLQVSHVVSPVAADVPFPWRLRTSTHETHLPAPTVRERRHPTALRSESGTRDPEARGNAPYAPPFPQLSPYNVSSEFVPRAVSQPNTPSFYPHTQQQHLNEPAPLTIIPRSPTYPPANRRRVRSATGTGEANFTTDEEFHLFVQATAGLGPEQSYRSPNTIHDAFSGEEVRHTPRYAPRSDINMISPEQETPTTTWALQQMAQMPYGTYIPQQQEVAASRPSMQRLETSSSGVDLWLQPPSTMLEDDYDVSPIEEDELPDYASSQAQAQAAQRLEAARRAQELQRKWRESRP